MHDGVEPLALCIVQVSPLQSVQIEANARDRGFELVRDGVEKRILTLVPTHFADQKNGVENNARNQNRKKDDSKDRIRKPRLVGEDPRNAERHGNTRKQHAERYECGNGSAAAIEVHRLMRPYVPG